MKSYTYSLLVLVLLAAAFVGVSSFVDKSEEPVTTTGSADNVAAVLQAVVGNPGESQTIVWTASEFPVSEVKINLIRKTSDSPVAYELVRAIAASAANTGSAAWTPAESDLGADLFIEIACIASTAACVSVVTPASAQ